MVHAWISLVLLASAFQSRPMPLFWIWCLQGAIRSIRTPRNLDSQWGGLRGTIYNRWVNLGWGCLRTLLEMFFLLLSSFEKKRLKDMKDWQ